MKDNGAAYAYAFDPKGALARAVGIRGYPSAVLVDATGTIVYQGHPGNLDHGTIASALDGALPIPVFRWPDALSKAAKAFTKGDLAKAIDEAADAGDEGQEVHAALLAMLEGKLKRLESLAEQGDYLGALTLADELGDAVKGRDADEARVKAVVDGIEDDKDKREIAKAQERVAKILAKEVKKNQVDKFVRDLEKLAEKHPGTAVERDAQRAIARLKAL